jgi:hypothetical protein
MLDYMRGLQTLKKYVPSGEEVIFQDLESRLRENLQRQSLQGETEALLSTRAAIVMELNQLALKYCGISFNEMCYAPQTAAITSTPFTSPDDETATDTNEAWLRRALETPLDDEIAAYTNETWLPKTRRPVPPRVTYQLLTRVMPTGYCYHLDVHKFPFVTITVDNSDVRSRDVTLHISATILDYSNPAVKSVVVQQGEKSQIALLPLLKRTAIATLNDIQPADLHITVKQPAETRPLYDETVRISLHARNTALLAQRRSDGSIEDLTESLAGWVTPRQPEIVRLLRQASKYHPEQAFIGYPALTTPAEVTDIVRKEVEAIFTSLKHDVQLVYTDTYKNLGAQRDQITQRVQLPSEVLVNGYANCLDGTVLFASLLELASLQPVIVLVPDHVFVGWHVYEDVERYEFLETTLIGHEDFQAAQRIAHDYFDNALFRGYFKRDLFHPYGFAKIIDIAASRQQEIYPLE